LNQKKLGKNRQIIFDFGTAIDEYGEQIWQSRYKLQKNLPNIKLQSIPAFFADARADAHEKMRVRRKILFRYRHLTGDKI